MKKNKLYALFIVFLALFLVVGLAYQTGWAQSQPENTPAPVQNRTISVTGTGSANASPDVAVVRIGVRTDANTAQEALSQNSQKMQDLLSALQNAGIARQDIQTQYIQLNPRYNQPSQQQANTPEVVGYSAANIVEVRVVNLESVGKILDSAVSTGGNTVEGIRFEISNQSDLYNQALEQAMTDARAKAERLADLSGAKLGEVLSITDVSAAPIPYGAGGANPAAAQAVPVEPGTQSVTANIQVTWLLASSQSIPSTGGTPVFTTSPSPTNTLHATETPIPSQTAFPLQTTSPFMTVPTSSPESPTGETATPLAKVTTLSDLEATLRSFGASVQPAGAIQQPFIPVAGQVLLVNGAEIQVFEFQDAASRQAASDSVSAAENVLSTTFPGNISKPNIWAQGQIIVMYFGEDQSTINLLNNTLG
jgi:uncharacterized protein YggE